MVYRSADPSMGCIKLNNAGFEYEELPCLYPKVRPFYTEWELAYDPVPIRDFMVDSPFLPIAACILYGLFIVWGRAYMAEKKPWSWRGVLALWNLILSVFSFCGVMRVGPHLLHNLRTYTMRDNLCNDPENTYGSGATGLWVQMFVLSKFPELIDTFFIVIHKKPLIFLHWYHHFTVLLYCWHAYVHKAPAGIFFIVMNYAVHSFMYGYYFLMSMKMKPKWMNAMFITVAQISQMIVGVIVTLLAFFYYKTDKNTEDDPCWIKKENNTAAFLMYGSYLFLFLQFFIGRYFKTLTKKKRTKESKKMD